MSGRPLRLEFDSRSGEAERSVGRPEDASARGVAGMAGRLGSVLGTAAVGAKRLSGAVAVSPSAAVRLLPALARRHRGEYLEDEWGLDPEFAAAALPALEFLYDVWWRVKAVGVTNVPGHGRALLVANHAGPLPWDAMMISMAVAREHPLPRLPRFAGFDWAFALPFLGILMRKLGGAPATGPDSERLLTQDELVTVFPEAAVGDHRPWRERYRIGGFGDGSFVEVALRTGAPIVPVAVVGSEEAYPAVADLGVVSRRFGIPTFPATPTFPWLGPLGLVPLPARWRIEFLQPVDLTGYGPEAARDRSLVLGVADHVRSTIQERIWQNLVERGSAFL